MSLLARLRKSPFAGAGFVRVTGNGMDWPGATITLAGTLIPPELMSEKAAGDATPFAKAFSE